MDWTAPETLKKFDKRMSAATDGLKESLSWGEVINAGGSPPPLLALHTSQPTEQVNLCLPNLYTSVCCYYLCRPFSLEWRATFDPKEQGHPLLADLYTSVCCYCLRWPVPSD